MEINLEMFKDQFEFSTEDLAKLIEITPEEMSKIESGELTPTVDVALKMLYVISGMYATWCHDYGYDEETTKSLSMQHLFDLDDKQSYQCFVKGMANYRNLEVLGFGEEGDDCDEDELDSYDEDEENALN